jgi:hypothetical protein
MAEVKAGLLVDQLDQEIRYLAGLCYARVRHRVDSGTKETDIENLRTRLRDAIDAWISTDLAAFADNE